VRAEPLAQRAATNWQPVLNPRAAAVVQLQERQEEGRWRHRPTEGAPKGEASIPP
jgi:hypothetical protein